MSVPGSKVTTNTGYLVISVCVTLSVFVIWENFTISISWAVRPVCILSTGKLVGMPLRTRRGRMESGTVYVG